MVTGDNWPNASDSSDLERPRPPSFPRQFARLAGPYWQSEEKWKVRGLTAVLILLTLGQVALMIWMNYWNERLFDALEQKSLQRFLVQIGVFAIILLTTTAVTVVHLRVKRRIQLDWRRWLTRRLVDLWMAEGHHYQLAHLPGAHDNPEGRIAEDIRNTTEVAMDLAHSFFYSLSIVVSFVGILWSLSGVLHLAIGSYDVWIPGHMVLAALIYAGVGSTLAYFLGRPYVMATDRRQTVEANMRFGLTRARENSEAIALIGGERGERRRIREFIRDIQRAWQRQTAALSWIMVFTSGYAMLATAFPIFIAAPRYIAGAITLGILMQTAQAFQQVTSALSWPVDNLAKRAEWRASAERVLTLYDALQKLVASLARIDERSIQRETADRPSLIFHGLCIENPDGQPITASFSGEIGAGEHVLISGDPDAATKLFKVVAGLWPWGTGRVELPKGGAIFFMPQQPYLAMGSLRAALSYPADPASYDAAAIAAALTRVGLPHLVSRIDADSGWEHSLTAGEKQRIGFAQLLLQRPAWIFLQEATDALGPRGEDEMMHLLQEEFRDATVLTVGYHPGLEAYHERKLTLKRSARGPVVISETPPQGAGGAKRETRPSWFGRLLAATGVVQR